ncbi:MAG: hypothetical protein KAX44_01830 [Candidatus Brocadiae bacterium]|nr:hypothetical protein [Candidatus Brocadiia bacterium]
MDSKLVQGMLLGTCLCLLLATAITLAHYGVYSEYVGLEPGAPVARGAEGRPVAEDVDLLKFAPPGTVGYLAVDVQAILASPLGQKLLEDPEAEVPDEVKQLGQVVLFFGAPTADEPPATCGLVKVTGKTAAEIAEKLAEVGTKTTVEGMDAYVMQEPFSAVLAVVDDSTVLGGSSEDELAKIIQVYQGGTPASSVSEMQQMGAAFAGDMVKGCVLITDEMKALPPEEEMPAWSLGAKGAGFGVSLRAGLELKGMLRLGSGDDASQAASDAQVKITEAKTWVQQFGQSPAGQGLDVQAAISLIDKVKVSADGADVNIAIELTEDDLGTLQEFAMSMVGMMMGGMMEAPGMAAPPGFGAP